ncbi:hypothetical protein KC325_g227 [Hortaea werneckii]|nr:hypothetical protein KC325_g227 [Hortaea werneckii]
MTELWWRRANIISTIGKAMVRNYSPQLFPLFLKSRGSFFGPPTSPVLGSSPSPLAASRARSRNCSSMSSALMDLACAASVVWASPSAFSAGSSRARGVLKAPLGRRGLWSPACSGGGSGGEGAAEEARAHGAHCSEVLAYVISRGKARARPERPRPRPGLCFVFIAIVSRRLINLTSSSLSRQARFVQSDIASDVDEADDKLANIEVSVARCMELSCTEVTSTDIPRLETASSVWKATFRRTLDAAGREGQRAESPTLKGSHAL